MKHFGWAETKLIPEVLFFQEGPGVRKWQFRESGVKLLNGRNINDNALDLSTTSVYLSEDEANGKYSHFLAEEGDFVIACSGITIEKFDKKSAFVKKEHLPLCMNTSTMRFKSLNENVLDIRFFNYYIRSNAFLSQLQRLITGSAQLNFGPSHVKKIAIPLPPLEEQKLIAGILDEADRVRKKTQALIDKYDELAQSLFLDMFGDPVTNLKGWEVVELGEKLDAKGGKRLPKGSDYSVSPTDWPYLRVADMRVNAVELGELKFLTEEVQSKISRYTISKDDVFISIAGTIGVAGWIPDELDGCNLTENAAKIVGLREASLRKEFLSFYLNSHFVQREIEARTMAVGVPKLALFRIESLPLMLPPLELQGEFLVRLGQIRASKIHLEQNDEEGNNLFEALLQKAFKGELN